MAYGIRVTLDDGTTRLYTQMENDKPIGPVAFATRADAEKRIKGLSWWWSRPHPDGKGGTKPFHTFEIVDLDD